MSLTKISNNSLSAISTLPASIPTGALTLLSTQTASSSASIEFTSGIDSTYDSYVFKFINIHPEVDGEKLQFNASTDGGSNYNATKTTTHFRAYHDEADANTNLGYSTGFDLAQSTGNQFLSHGLLGDADSNVSGYLKIFNPSSSTYVKNFIARTNSLQNSSWSIDGFFAGYINTTSPVNAIKFMMDANNIDDGIIKMYGVS